jgi:hypothetical protein
MSFSSLRSVDATRLQKGLSTFCHKVREARTPLAGSLCCFRKKISWWGSNFSSFFLLQVFKFFSPSKGTCELYVFSCTVFSVFRIQVLERISSFKIFPDGSRSHVHCPVPELLMFAVSFLKRSATNLRYHISRGPSYRKLAVRGKMVSDLPQ